MGKLIIILAQCVILLSTLAIGCCMSCNKTLGLENGEIKDNQISASESDAGTKSFYVRYNGSKSWCVNGQYKGVFNDNFYLQIDLLEVKKVTGILLGVSKSYRQFSYGPKIKIAYKLASSDSFKSMIFDTSGLKYPKSEYIKFQPSFQARFVRYMPYLDENAKCLNMELLGCDVTLTDCNKSVLNDTMDYTQSSYYTSQSGQKFIGKYIATSISPFPWGPDAMKTIIYPYQEYVHVDLKDQYLLTGVKITKPMYGFRELDMPESFIVLHKTSNDVWKNITGIDGKVLEINTTTSLKDIEKFISYVKATNIEIRPKIPHSKRIFLKLQLFGCLFKDAFPSKPSEIPKTTNEPVASSTTTTKSKNLVSTSTIPSKPAFIEFYEIRQGNRYKDVGYVGMATKDVLHDGKGVLVDGFDGSQAPFRPSVWVGWRKQQLPTPYVIIILKNAAVLKNLILVNYVDRKQNIGQLASCTIQFSKNEVTKWSNGYYVCPRDEKKTGASEIKINLMQKFASRIRLTFNYSEEWLLLSEVTLNSYSKVANSLDISSKFCNISSTTVKRVDPENSTLLLLSILIPLLLILAILIVLIIKYRKKIRYCLLKRRNKKYDGQNATIVTYTKEENHSGSIEHMYAVVKDDDDTTLKKSPLYKREENANKLHPNEYELADDDNMYAAPDQDLLTDVAPIGYIEVSVEPGNQSPVPNYAKPDAKKDIDTIELNPIYEGSRIYEDPYQTVTGSSLYADPHMDKERVSIEIRKFPREKLRFMEKIGEGQFGEVHICEVDPISCVLDNADRCSWRMNNTVMVAVKLLKSGVEKAVESEFMKEVRVMARLKHDNVVQLLGVCEEEPKCMVVEYMENGDLNQFLKNYNLAEYNVNNEVRANTLNEETLEHICTQIAAGMKYLSSQGFIHRDLATRNCLVGHSFTVKISDFGMSRYLYSKQYYRIEGKAVLPIRWMAPESLFYGTFTSQTDVWAFAVTIWEIFTFAKEAPFSHLTDQQVIDNACSVVAKQRKSFRCLSKPRGCADEIYQILLRCWQRSPDDRPSFDELFQFFSSRSTSVEASI